MEYDTDTQIPFTTTATIKPKSKQSYSCFLCSQVNSSDSELALEFETYSLRYICRYLKVERESVLNRTFKDNLDSRQDASLMNSWKDFVVLLCGSCADVTTKLTSLLKTLELTQMRVNYQVQMFNQILRSQQEINKKPKTPSGPRSVKAKAKLENGLRQVVAEKCEENI